MNTRVKLGKVDLCNSQELAKLLSEDTELIQALVGGGTQASMTAAEFLEGTENWQKKTNSTSFAILLDERPIGLISLSYKRSQSARVGYWLGSKYWNQGYATESFRLIANLAREGGFTHLSATISSDNLASLRIWKKLGAKITTNSAGTVADLSL